MRLPITDRNTFFREFKFQTSRSSGPGGQHVNKVSSRVELRFNVRDSQILSDDDKTKLSAKLITRINNEGVLSIVVQADRSQLKNKQAAIEKFFDLLTQVFTPIKKRRPTKPTRGARERRLQTKRLGSEKKSRRRNPNLED
ncbi:alternative ribosome rescue aminoacyl-tRNA hydrolase ArfB [Ancylomarina sp. 16SWW S1-10-2]|uniref:alternative ribosome rescue aminoacyl-tRNA hydrolase ArfB n=1 Tax=Ancylomarina sp. 16SWW S1-10-2 TaxID=2499681 RepID=UPI0012ADAA5F|nr:alternative ribosome rescue aminoacyl-tRNA hydrolase ArfB [Ancylomarina sp. 16SWW S1-10-2]MRT92721.1 aminoacyl-tRNA hydrolase [Ancylomarina sp. 16SWW S1-10-2]